MRSLSLLLLLSSLGLGLFLGCAGPRGGEPGRTSNVALTLVSFGSIQGELTECG